MIFLVILLGVGVWVAWGYAGNGFLARFAKLLDRPQIVAGFINCLSGRSYLKGEFSGRKVTILLERIGEDRPSFLVVSMETSCLRALSHSDFEDHARDHAGEMALFALKARHDLRLALSDGCVKARAEQQILRPFPGRFDPDKWRDVLQQMHALAGSLERRLA